MPPSPVRLCVFLLVSLLLLRPAVSTAAARVGPAEGGLHEVRFSFAPQIAASSVSVAGSFNGWRKDDWVLQGPDGSGTFALTVRLAPGRYSYKFVVDGRTWTPDPEGPGREPDGFEGFNSVVVVGPGSTGGPVAAPSAQARGDGRIWGPGAFHGPGIDFREWVPGERLAVLRLRTAAGDVEGVTLLVDGKGRPMRRVLSGADRDLWEAEVRARRFRYAFELEDGPAKAWLGPGGLSARPGGSPFSFDAAQAPRLEAPEWVKDSVFYQIFPERFADGDPSNDPPGSEVWGASPTIENHFGGDLQGVLDRVPYLRSLGVDALYLNPIFESPSSHKYDTADYLRIDPHFGDEALFGRLARALHGRGMRLVLDGVFNHSGDRFWAFQDVLRDGGASRYASWYTLRGSSVTQSPPNYECWWGFSHLPKLDTSDPGARGYLLGVGEHWLKAGADGWRLDVPNEVPHGFWKEFRRRARAARPEAYIVGEIWTDGLPWLGGDEFDAVMNYVFRSAVLSYFARKEIPLSELHQRLLEQRHGYPRGSLAAQFNLLGSHDTARLATVFKGEAAALRLAVLFQMTYLGAPVVYYGDEVGLEGDKDPDCRRCFPWEESRQDRGLLEHYRRLIAIRKSRPELRRGGFEALRVDSERDLYAFVREHRGRACLVVLHRGEGAVPLELALPASLAGAASLKDLYSGRTYPVRAGKLLLEAGPFEGLILAR